jgi:hypothetical protein
VITTFLGGQPGWRHLGRWVRPGHKWVVVVVWLWVTWPWATTAVLATVLTWALAAAEHAATSRRMGGKRPTGTTSQICGVVGRVDHGVGGWSPRRATTRMRGAAGQQRGFRRWASKEGGKSSTWVMGRELRRGASCRHGSAFGWRGSAGVNGGYYDGGLDAGGSMG